MVFSGRDMYQLRRIAATPCGALLYSEDQCSERLERSAERFLFLGARAMIGGKWRAAGWAAAAAALAGGAVWVMVASPLFDASPVDSGGPDDQDPSATSLVQSPSLRKPPPVSKAGFVGSQACTKCHAEIAERYQSTHSMARATQPATEAPVIEDYQQTQFSTEGGRLYKIIRSAAGLIHSESLADAQGQLLFDQSEKIDYVMGSGRRGRAYLLDRQGLLFESPISWYTQDQKFDLSPGYPPNNHLRFDRKISQECMFCHAGETSMVDSHNDRFAGKAIVEGGIGCERCHGPGQKHIEKHRHTQGEAVATPEGDDSIANPGKLPPAQREAVCYQCHLRAKHIFTRYGREYDDFRPGQRLEEIWTAFVSRDTSNTPTLVEQVRVSRCYQKSEGKLGCISCHDPHERPGAEQQAEYYRQRCLTCHEQQGCSLPEEEQQAAPAAGSCIHCHMPRAPTRGVPHTALTDHRILRNPSLTPATFEEGEAPIESLVLFDDAAKRLPKADIDRAWGMLLATRAAAEGDVGLAERAIDFLNPHRDQPIQGLEIQSLDAPALVKLGLAYVVTGRNELAIASWKRALKERPGNEQILHSLTLAYLTHSDPAAGLEFAGPLVESNPHLAEYHWLHATLLDRVGKLPEAIAAAELAIERDPTATPIRAWLAQAYDRTNQPEKSQQQRALLARWPVEAMKPTEGKPK